MQNNNTQKTKSFFLKPKFLYQAILSGFLTGAVFFKSIKLYFSKWVRIFKKDNTKQAEENSN